MTPAAAPLPGRRRTFIPHFGHSMPASLSIHIGVNVPRRFADRPLHCCENDAWRMAAMAERAGYDSLRVLRGAAATRQAVHEALTAASGSLAQGDTLLVSFSGHGAQEPDTDHDEGHGWDEAWCLHDGIIVDDQLAGYWRLFQPGVRIVVVAECCYSGGIARDDEDCDPAPSVGREVVYRSSAARRGESFRPVPFWRTGVAYRSTRRSDRTDHTRSCIAEPPRNTHGIRASLLLLAASHESQPARDGLFCKHLLEVWNDGAFSGTYCELYAQIRERVMTERCRQEPQLLMLGAPDPTFPLERAFHLNGRESGGSVAYRGSAPGGG
ncbi:MAG TPA: caspase family protein [Longimicrobium sp.]|nr:caspase family protein [Longimicrobium sp.]